MILNRIIIKINFIFSTRKVSITVVVLIVFPLDSSGLDIGQHFSAFYENGEWRNTLGHPLENFFSVH